MNSLSEEKKQAAPGEDDAAAKNPFENDASRTSEGVERNTKSHENGNVAPIEAPKQTLSGQAALHSTASTSKVNTADKPSQETSPADSDSPLSPRKNQKFNEEEDSSNDDSSYFADPSNLPSPGEAGRKYSYGSHASAKKNGGARESDASLSLSEDSDDPNSHSTKNNKANSTYVQQASEVFPQQRITRMHSVGSLVSTSSQNSEHEPAVERNPNQQQYQVPYQGFVQPHAMTEQWMNQQSIIPGNVGAAASGYHPGGVTPSRDVSSMQTDGNTLGKSYEGKRNSGRDSKSHRNASRDRQKKTIDLPEQPGGTAIMKDDDGLQDEHFKVYWARWIMLMYMSLLNLLSDWTCYSVAPIALLTQEAFGDLDPETLVTIFLAANAFASACEPIILSRLGLRRTVLFGALLLMVGSIIKSGGMPPIIQPDLEKGRGEWRVYVGFFLVGLSQPLYQCTPALLSASWFPEHERTMATGVALNANQLGIGFAFIFGTLLVANSDDIPAYFGLLSLISTITFFGTLFQFEDAPPTPPSDSARVMRGTLEVDLPSVKAILQSIGVGNNTSIQRDIDEAMQDDKRSHSGKQRSSSNKNRRSSKSSGIRKGRTTGPPKGESTRRKSRTSKSKPESNPEAQAQPPSSAPWDVSSIVAAPSPMMPGLVSCPPAEEAEGERRSGEQRAFAGYPYGHMYSGLPPGPPMGAAPMQPFGPGYGVPQGFYYAPYQQQAYQGYYQMPYYDQRYQQLPHHTNQAPYNQQVPHYGAYSGNYQHQPPRPDQALYSDPYSVLPPAEGLDAGVEPVLTITPHHLDIDIRDDQIILATRACFARPGFIHSLVSFTVSGIVINTLSTYMDYLVRLNGAGREYTGIVGGSFQVVIMISSLIIGSVCDKSRAYYSVAIAMLVIGAFGLAECGVSLNADRGSDLRVALILVAALVGPLQPVSTELGVEVVYPLSENTVLVIQQLFSNLLSALFIPLFKVLKDVGISNDDTDTDNEGTTEQPEYTFSFYLLIVLHAAATVFFATFNGRYLRYEHELQKKEAKERKRQIRENSFNDTDGNASLASMGSFQPSVMSGTEGYGSNEMERQPMVHQHQIV